MQRTVCLLCQLLNVWIWNWQSCQKNGGQLVSSWCWTKSAVGFAPDVHHEFIKVTVIPVFSLLRIPLHKSNSEDGSGEFHQIQKYRTCRLNSVWFGLTEYYFERFSVFVSWMDLHTWGPLRKLFKTLIKNEIFLPNLVLDNFHQAGWSVTCSPEAREASPVHLFKLLLVQNQGAA